MNEDTHRLWDLALKAVAIAATLVGIYVGYDQFIAEWELNNRKPYLEIRTKYYLEMVENVGKIVYPESLEEQQINIRRFWQSYVGVSALVEDRNVEEKINSFSTCLDINKVKCEQFMLEAKSLSLSNSIRESLLNSWGAKSLEGKYVDGY